MRWRGIAWLRCENGAETVVDLVEAPTLEFCKWLLNAGQRNKFLGPMFRVTYEEVE